MVAHVVSGSLQVPLDVGPGLTVIVADQVRDVLDDEQGGLSVLQEANDMVDQVAPLWALQPLLAPGL